LVTRIKNKRVIFLLVAIFGNFINRVVVLTQKYYDGKTPSSQVLNEKEKDLIDHVTIIFTHFFINIGMVLGLVPTIGIPLPFLSYGGSSLMSFILLFSIYIKLDSERKSRW
jgi:cell division protein FtsW (lipid II flippase)